MQLRENISLLPYNTFRIPVKARYFVEVDTEESLPEILNLSSANKWPLLVLGGGSNMLFTRDFDGLVIRIAIQGISQKRPGHTENFGHTENLASDQVLVTAGAGVVWNEFVKYCVSNNYAGIENLSLIPGTVGAAPVQNIGAYGVELKDVFYSLRAYDIQKNSFRDFKLEECEFAYRNSIFKTKYKGRFIITTVCLLLSRNGVLNTSYGAIKNELDLEGLRQPGISDISRIVSRIRVGKLPDPSTIGNAGSFFKNPVIPLAEFQKLNKKFPDLVHFPDGNGLVKIAAGWMIEYCGFKGKVEGNTGTWKNQALVLVNHGGASGNEIFAFAEKIIRSVKETFGIQIEAEVNLI